MKDRANQQCESIAHIFISHMVQMKVLLRVEASSVVAPLYPTWFRWKYNFLNEMRQLLEDFISHMVQMKDR